MADMISGLLVCSSAEQAAFKRVQDARQACLEENKRSLASRKAAIAAKHTLNATSDSISSQDKEELLRILCEHDELRASCRARHKTLMSLEQDMKVQAQRMETLVQACSEAWVEDESVDESVDETKAVAKELRHFLDKRSEAVRALLQDCAKDEGEEDEDDDENDFLEVLCVSCGESFKTWHTLRVHEAERHLAHYDVRGCRVFLNMSQVVADATKAKNKTDAVESASNKRKRAPEQAL